MSLSNAVGFAVDGCSRLLLGWRLDDVDTNRLLYFGVVNGGRLIDAGRLMK